MPDPSSKRQPSRLVYDGAVFRIEFCVAPSGVAPAEAWLEQLLLQVNKGSPRCLRAWETGGDLE